MPEKEALQKQNRLNISRILLLKTFVKSETLSIDDLVKEENIGLLADPAQVCLLLTELTDAGLLYVSRDATDLTYTITLKGIEECVRLNNVL